MLELYTWTLAQRSILTLLIALCVIGQTQLLVLNFYRHPQTVSRFLTSMLELSVLFHLLVLSLLTGQGQQSHHVGLIVPTGYLALRYCAAAFVLVFAGIVIARGNKLWTTLAIIAAFLTLPLWETNDGIVYVCLFITALLIWLIRGALCSLTCYSEIQSSISYLSVKDAVDSLRTGILFSEPDGAVVLVNEEMQRLMMIITGRIHRNSRDFYDLLLSGIISHSCRKTEYEGQMLYLLPDETAWAFTKTEIMIGNKQYMQYTAADITERWALTARLRQQEELLLVRSEELKGMIGDLKALSQTRELQNAKLRAHDILGKRLTLLLYSLSSGQELDYDLLNTQIQGLHEDLKASQSASSPMDKLDNLRHSFKTIGVEIHLAASLPEDTKKGYLFVDIISESVVNAVRHGFATEVFVAVELTNGDWCLEITDNGSGYAHNQPVKEGGGIGAIRHKIEPWGGRLTVENQPRFSLQVVLPKGETNA